MENKDKNKYYTPDITEFKVGFEYEIYEDFDYYPEKVWHKQVYGKNGRISENMDYVDESNITKFRVKYLDKEDILDLGFIKKGRNEYVLENPKINNPNCYRTHLYLSFYPLDDCNIIIDDDGGYESDTYFSGRIKNKSELKDILDKIV